MYCPKCTVEYREGFTQCADCEIPLVYEMPPSSAEDEPEFVDLEEVLTTTSRGQIAFIKSLLEAENVPYLVQGENFNAIQGPVPVRFLIPRQHIKRARQVLKKLL